MGYFYCDGCSLGCIEGCFKMKAKKALCEATGTWFYPKYQFTEEDFYPKWESSVESERFTSYSQVTEGCGGGRVGVNSNKGGNLPTLKSMDRINVNNTIEIYTTKDSLIANTSSLDDKTLMIVRAKNELIKSKLGITEVKAYVANRVFKNFIIECYEKWFKNDRK